MKTLYYIITGVMLVAGPVTSAQNEANPDFNLEANTILEREMDVDVRYYYYPNLQAYFDTKTLTYIYSRNNEWVEANRIPPGYKGYSVRNGHRVALEGYLGDLPHEFVDEHKKQYPPQYIAKRQAPIDSDKDTKGLALN